MKAWLSRKGVPYVEKDVSRDRAAAEEMVRKSRQMGVPVITVDGEVVVGFNTRALEGLLARAATAGPSLGLKVADAAKIALKKGSGPTGGAYVGQIDANSPGQRAGLQVGDVIVSVDGQAVTGADDLSAILGRIRAGQTVEIAYLRDGQTQRARATL